MARGHFRTDDKTCLHCGFYDGNSMPYKYGRGANQAYLCKKCADKSRAGGTEIVVHKYTGENRAHRA